jgi:hypothetical protein
VAEDDHPRAATSIVDGRRSVADEVDGVSCLGAQVDGFTTAAAVLADVRRLTGRLPVLVDLRFDRSPEKPVDDLRGPWARPSRYDRPGRGETLRERVARQRRQEGSKE